MSGLQSLQGSPKLAHLSLSNNRIKDLETLEPLVSTNLSFMLGTESSYNMGHLTYNLVYNSGRTLNVKLFFIFGHQLLSP